MKAFRDRAALVLAVISLAVSGFLLLRWPNSQPASADSSASGDLAASEEAVAELQASIKWLSSDLRDLKRAVGDIQPDPATAGSEADGEGDEEGPDNSPPPFASIDERLQNLEGSLARLRSNYEGISIEGASAERAELFASAEGALKADEYFEAGKYSIAAEGYLTFLRNHPDDPDGRNILQRARGAYQRAGYRDLAIWVQEEMLKSFPEHRVADLKQLAQMEKTAGNYDAAIAYAAESASLETDAQSRLWTRLYWAWYNELGGGAPAGLDAYLEVQQEITNAGFADHKLNARAQQKIDELRNRMATATQ